MYNQPVAIVTRVFKAKYFSRDGFLRATLRHNPSYVCRDICGLLEWWE